MVVLDHLLLTLPDMVLAVAAVRLKRVAQELLLLAVMAVMDKLRRFLVLLLPTQVVVAVGLESLEVALLVQAVQVVAVLDRLQMQLERLELSTQAVVVEAAVTLLAV